MTVVHQEVGAVLLRRDRELAGRRAERDDLLHADLVLALALAVLLHGARHADGRLLREPRDAVERLVADVAFERDALHDAEAVAQLDERELAARTQVVDPALQRHVFADVRRELARVDRAGRCHGGPSYHARADPPHVLTAAAMIVLPS